jgi:hypothetical protein
MLPVQHTPAPGMGQGRFALPAPSVTVRHASEIVGMSLETMQLELVRRLVDRVRSTSSELPEVDRQHLRRAETGELSNRDIKLVAATLRRIRGTLPDPRGDPVPKASVMLLGGITPQAIISKDDGSFEFGSQWRMAECVTLEREGLSVRVLQAIPVNGHDLDGVKLILNTPFSLHGKTIAKAPEGSAAQRLPTILPEPVGLRFPIRSYTSYMGMYAYAQQVSPDRLASFQENPDQVALFLRKALRSLANGSDFADPRWTLDLHKYWDILHYILRDPIGRAAAPGGDPILGGTEIGDDMNYGPARFLTAQDVREIAGNWRSFPGKRSHLVLISTQCAAQVSTWLGPRVSSKGHAPFFTCW